MPKTTPYQYKATDNYLDVADRHQITPQALLDANPGGYPFSTGQNINIPQILKTALNFSPAFATPGAVLGNWAFQRVQQGLTQNQAGNVPAQYKPYMDVAKSQASAYNNPPTPNNYNVDARGRGYTTPSPISSYDGIENARVQRSQEQEVQYALTSTTPPNIVSPWMAEKLGFDPSQNGYVFQNGNWILDPNFKGQYAPEQNAGQAQPQTDNNYMTNPRLHLLTFNKNAHNRNNTYTVTEQWLNNRYKRQKHGGGGGGGSNNAGGVTGFGLVNFSAGSG